jgi:long-chain acyl-CoA synthetase
MEGYWNDAEATAATLTELGLRTGDLAHADEDGYLYIDGRTTSMIKTAGYRVNAEEIEAVLHEIDEIHAVAVAGVPDEQLGEAITAFVQLRAGAELEADAIIAYSRRRLPRHKEVRQVVFVDALPATPTGKLLRSRLAAPLTQ